MRSPTCSSSQTLARALVAWQRAAGPYWLYVCAAPFIGPPLIGRGDRPAPASRAEVAACAADLDPGRSALFVDLAPEEALAEAPALRAAGWWVVPVIQRWCAPAALLPAQPLRSSLIDVGRRLPCQVGSIAPGAVFLLDGARRGPLGQLPPQRFDNRYEYPTCRFPPPELLRARGIEVVAWLARGGTAPDLAEYAAALAAAGLAPQLRASG
ncbi:MAG TPA: hypothetical protein VGL23_00145 [Chloroflexota bacterium]|jgi:hypothetical protein